MKRWFRFYEEAVNDDKVRGLSSDTLRWQWVILLATASKYGGDIPSLKIAAINLNLNESKTAVVVAALHRAGLLDPVDDGYFRPHNWQGRQPIDATAAERKRKQRQKERDNLDSHAVTTVTGHKDVTPLEIRDKSKEEREERKKELVAADAACDKNVSHETSPLVPAESPKDEPKGYAFAGTVVRLTQRDFEKWKTAYSRLDLRAELVARDAWLAELPPTDNRRTKWFPSTSQHLANRNAEAMARANPQKTRYPDPHDWRNAIA